jgi:DinB superfamily
MGKAIGRPELSEIAPHAKAYVDLVPGDDVLAVLDAQIVKTTEFLKSLSEAHAATFAYAPGKWTIKQIVGHLSDCERIFACRALRLARGDTTPLPSFEQDGYVAAANSNERTLASLVEELELVRKSTLVLLKSLPDAAWLRRGLVSDRNATVRGIAYTLAGHELHHFKILQERYVPAI